MTKIILITLITYPVFGQNSGTLYLAGGCFWCTEKSFQDFPGVLDAISGYCNGDQNTASYDLVSSGKTNHRECLLIKYDKQATGLEKLMLNYIQNIDPMDNQGQFADRGNQYKIEIYYNNEEEIKIAKNLLEKINKKEIYEKKLNIPILPFKSFFPAEEYHQDFYKKEPLRYKAYEKASGRQKFIKKYLESFNK